MRVELLYTPGCSSYRKALNILETVIAEERLPCPVELKEVDNFAMPQITVDGESLNAKVPCIEELRSLLSKRWHMLTGMILQNA